MAIETFGNGGMTITGNDIGTFRLIAMRGALKMETLGMKRRGASASSMVREILNVKTRNKKDLLIQFEDYLFVNYGIKPKTRK